MPSNLRFRDTLMLAAGTVCMCVSAVSWAAAGEPQNKSVPSAADVEAIEFKVTSPDARRTKATFRVTERDQLAAVVAHLSLVDWSQTGAPLAEIQIKRPEIEFTLRAVCDRSFVYQFYWQGKSLIDQQSSRLVEADLDGLRRQIVALLVEQAATKQDGKELPSALMKLGEFTPTDENWVAALSPDGGRLAVAYPHPRSRDFVLWDVAANRIVARNQHAGQFRQIVFAPDGKSLLAMVKVEPTPPMTRESWDIRRFATDDLRSLGKVGACRDYSVALAISADGRRLVAVLNGYVKLWDIETGKELEIRRWSSPAPPPAEAPFDGYPQCAAFSPDGKVLALGANDKTVSLFNTANGSRLARFEIGALVASVNFSADGELLAVCPGRLYEGDGPPPPSSVQPIFLVDLRSKTKRRAPVQHASAGLFAAFASDRESLITAGDDSIKLWNLKYAVDPEATLAAAQSYETDEIYRLEVAANSPTVMTRERKKISVWRLVR